MIILAPYDPSWPVIFAAEAVRIRQALGDHARRIEHVGSTSVPGLADKPGIDIQVSVPSQKLADGPSTHHVHLCVAGSEQERHHLAFRDFPRRDPSVAAEYAALKRELAAAHDGLTLESQERYSLSRTEFVRSVLARVLVEGHNSDASRS